jgi:hypothetical protein
MPLTYMNSMQPTWMTDHTWTPFLDDGTLPIRWRAVPYLASRYSFDEARRILGIKNYPKSRSIQALVDYYVWFALPRQVRGEMVIII